MAASLGPILLLLALVLLWLRVPLALALLAISVPGLLLMPAGGALPSAIASLFSSLDGLLHSPGLLLVPLVVLLGNLALYAGISTRIYDASAVWLRSLPGGPALAAVLGCGGFAAISGSSTACASTMGRICVPEMLRLGYDPKLAAASVAAGGTLGSLIPPSILFVLFGILTDRPIAPLFMAGILPGLLSLAGMIAVVAWWVRSDPGAAPDVPRTTATPLDATFAAWPAILIFAVIVFGIFSRALTVAQAVAISVALTLAIGVAQTRLTWGAVWRACRESLIESVSILLVLAGAWLFADFATQSGMAEAFSMSVAQLDPSYLMLMLAIALIYLIIGMFLDPLAILVLTLPFLARLVADYHLNPVWLGVVIVKLLEIGLITPPVGLNVYIIAGVTRDMGIDRIFAGIGRFLAVDLLVLTILILFPAVSLLIPTAMGAVP